MSTCPACCRVRTEGTRRFDMSSASFLCRFHGQKSTTLSSTESLVALQPPPRHLHRRMLSRDRRRPLIIFYSPRDIVDGNDVMTDVSLVTEDELSEDESPRSKRSGDDRVFGSNGKAALDFSASVGARETTLTRSRGPFMRMSQSFTRASDRMDPTMWDGRRDKGRAARQSAKYDVAWRQDEEKACCQVCFAMFTRLSRRRHHCRVCGELVCGTCSQDQVALTNKFHTPRRACVACCTLLQAMARAGDERVEIVQLDVAGTSLIKRHYQSPPAESTCHSPTLSAPAATPCYRDRLAEVRRVMAAGKLSRRRGSPEKKMYVISSRWLRKWVTFTSSASRSNSNCDLAYGFDADKSTRAATNNDMNIMSRAPGPIDNLSLLELSRGKLVRRPGLIRDNAISGDVASAGEVADFQLLSPEVWEVFQRLYGGAPAIYVNLTSADPMAWIIDVSDLLTAGTDANDNKIQVHPAVDRALTSRHMNEDYFCDLSAGSNQDLSAGSNQAQSPTAFSSNTPPSSHTPVKSRFARSRSNQQPPESPVWTVTSSSSSSSLSEAKDRVRSPIESDQVRLEDLTPDVASLSIGVNKVPTESDEDMRATTSVRSPTAAYAASAFAVAMKQARLNAQKAIDDRASRVIAA